ncbi:MAG: outer membrane beta-barrel domain-containing protein [Pseudomonadota bacterium]
MMKLQRVFTLSTVGLSLSGLLPTPALAKESPADEAVARLSGERSADEPIKNRFFLKASRFEIAPVGGYVPNNPFARRYVGGVMLAYHISESFAAEGAILYSPDLVNDDLKGLTKTLVQIAHQGDPDAGFQQPIDKMTMGATFAARWAPVYGKINLLGERVLNFDFYGTLGLGLLTLAEYYATYDEGWDTGASASPIMLSEATNKYTVPVNVGVGFDFFLNQTVALKLDARSYLYIGSEADYDPNDDTALGSRLYNNFIASAGVSIFVPKMKPRLYDF